MPDTLLLPCVHFIGSRHTVMFSGVWRALRPAWFRTGVHASAQARFRGWCMLLLKRLCLAITLPAARCASKVQCSLVRCPHLPVLRARSYKAHWCAAFLLTALECLISTDSLPRSTTLVQPQLVQILVTLLVHLCGSARAIALSPPSN